MARVVAAEPATPPGASALRSYTPSWLDYLMRGIDRLPGPAWGFYLGTWVVLFAAYTVAKWFDGTYSVGTLSPFHAVYTGLAIYVLATAHYANKATGGTMRAFRTMFAGDDADFSRLEYEITTTPARPALLTGLVGLLIGVFINLLLPQSIQQAQKVFTSPLSNILDGAIIIGLWIVLATVMYQTIRQLRLISHIYLQHTRIDPFMPGPLYAFSTLTARTALLIMLALYAWFATDPSPQLANIPFFSAMAIFGLVAVTIFARPLLALHEALTAEKCRLQDENGRQIKDTVAELHRRISAGEMNAAAEIEGVINSLMAERTMLEKLRTWPWEPETARLVITATLLPMILWAIQRVLERLGL